MHGEKDSWKGHTWKYVDPKNIERDIEVAEEYAALRRLSEDFYEKVMTQKSSQRSKAKSKEKKAIAKPEAWLKLPIKLHI
jgi:hypothetical protein